jgi:cation-transporting ATPase 13A3/4/5
VLLNRYGASVTDILWKLLDMITIAVPPALPACLTIASSLSILRLQRKKIFTVDAERIGVAGSVNTVCFDKTGTLTDSTLALEALWVVTPESAEDGITSLSVSDLRVGSCSSEGSKSAVQDSADRFVRFVCH